MVFSRRLFNTVNATLSCSTSLIPIVTKFTYLGITLDPKLLWFEHINDLVSRIGPAINFLKTLASSHWGSDPSIMSIFYKSFIRSKLDYGCVFYGSASHSQLLKLDRLQNKALRFIIGATNSTLICALSSETGISPLEYRRNLLTDRFLARNMTQLNPDLISSIKQITINWRFTPSKLPLLCKRAITILKLQKFTIKLPTYQFKSLQFSQLFKSFKIHKLPLTRNSSSQLIFNQYTHQHFPNSTPIFSDGSRSDSGVGAAFWIPSSNCYLRLSLPPFTSVFHAEQVAIFTAAHYVNRNHTSHNFLIVSDSLSALESFTSPPSHDNHSLASYFKLLLLNNERLQFHFLWVPSHVGILDNEKVII